MIKVTLNEDDWEVVGKQYNLLSLKSRPNSTAVELTLEYDGQTETRVVAYHMIEFQS